MAPDETTVVLPATVTRADIPDLCARAADLLRDAGRGTVLCEVSGVARPDVVTVEALARLRLTARRYGRRLLVCGAGPDLLRIIALLGLADALPERSVQPGGQPEQREQPGGVEEVVHHRDPSSG
ncbi:STAS domain-containing protein [Plantactinospora sp. GCM10030261]|uniref:STAS domain-containing protein n=1 Tax=Plantactinospora sp. GCM10030261 TaxID=3273420 RepID=UPI0036121ABE